MSEYKTYKGKLAECYIELNTLEEKLLQLFKVKDITLSVSEIDNIEYTFYDYDLYDEYTILDDKLYKVIEKNDLGYDDIFEMNENNDGELEYLVHYYNGGCGFDEALEHAYKRMKR